MQRPANMVPASGPTITARRADVARLTAEGLDQRAIAAELGCGATTVVRDQRALGIDPGPPGKPVKYPPVELGVCGTPGCTDPDCAIEPGTCHCGCGARTPIAGKSERRLGRIKGEPCRFIRGHDVLSDEGRRIQSANMAAKRADGTISTEHLSPASQRRWSLGTGLEGLASRYGGRARQRWFGRWRGREYGTLGGRPPVELTDEQRAEVKRLDELGWGREAIASRVHASEWAVRKELDA